MESRRGRLLISGASGMLGTALRAALARRRDEVTQLVRREPAAADQVVWNPAGTQLVQDPGALEGCSAAIHLSGASVAERRWSPAYRQELMASRVNSTRGLAALLVSLRQPPRTLMVASAIGFYGNRGDELLDESSVAGTGFLPDLCQQWEAAAQPASEAGIRVVHLRFGVVLGPGEGALAQMLPIFRLGLGGKLGNGRQWISWIGIGDAIAGLLFVLDTPALTGPVNLTAPNPVTNAGFTIALAKQLGRPAFLPVPAFAARLAFGQMAEEALLASARIFPRKLQDAGFGFTQPVIEGALAEALGPVSP